MLTTGNFQGCYTVLKIRTYPKSNLSAPQSKHHAHLSTLMCQLAWKLNQLFQRASALGPCAEPGRNWKFQNFHFVRTFQNVFQNFHFCFFSDLGSIWSKKNEEKNYLFSVWAHWIFFCNWWDLLREVFFPGEIFSGEFFSRGDFFWGVFFQGRFFLGRGDFFWGGFFQGSFFQGRFILGRLFPGRFFLGEVFTGEFFSGRFFPGRFFLSWVVVHHYKGRKNYETTKMHVQLPDQFQHQQ